MKRALLLMLLCGLWLFGCVPQVTPVATPTSTPTSTWTPSPVQGGIATPASRMEVTPVATPTASRMEGDNLYLEFTQKVTNGFVTLHATAHTCSGINGPWEGAFEIDLTYSNGHISGSGSFQFTVPEDGSVARGIAPFAGAGTVAGTTCVILDVSDPLQYEIAIAADGSAATVLMRSVGGGTITSQCGDDPPVTIPFVMAWNMSPVDVPIMPYDDCPRP